MKRMKILFSIFLLLLITGCGISDEDTLSAQKAQGLLAKDKKALSTAEQKYQTLKKSSDFKMLEKYAKKEKWEDIFKLSKEKFKKADKVSADIDKILDNNDSDDEPKLRVVVNHLKTSTKEASEVYNRVPKRINFLKGVMKSVRKINDEAKKETEEVTTLFENLKVTIEKTKVDYPNKVEDLNKKFSAIQKRNIDNQALLFDLIAESKKSKAIMDYALIGDNGVKISQNLQQMKDTDKNFRKLFAQLYRSYTKILKDMKVDFYISIGRTSWDNYSDYNTERNYEYQPTQVSEEIFNYFEKLTVDEIGYYRSGNVYPKSGVNSQYLTALKINPKISWPSRHDAASYWLANTPLKYYHKYTIIENDKTIKTGWVKVNEAFFYKHEPNLGMEILSKPFGFYEDESITTPAPAGMSTVGNSKYGRWDERTDNTGRSYSFWHYYGMYSFWGNMMGRGHYYSRNDYNSYNSHRSSNTPYYGSNKQYGTWGVAPLAMSNRKASNYAKTRSASSSSSRSSGGRSRGRGPGGGGK